MWYCQCSPYFLSMQLHKIQANSPNQLEVWWLSSKSFRISAQLNFCPQVTKKLNKLGIYVLILNCLKCFILLDLCYSRYSVTIDTNYMTLNPKLAQFKSWRRVGTPWRQVLHQLSNSFWVLCFLALILLAAIQGTKITPNRVD